MWLNLKVQFAICLFACLFAAPPWSRIFLLSFRSVSAGVDLQRCSRRQSVRFTWKKVKWSQKYQPVTALLSTEEDRAVLLTCVSPASSPDSDSTPGRQGYDAKLLWRWRRKKVTTCWLIDWFEWFLILWSSSAWARRGLLLCRWTPLLSFICCFPGCCQQSQSRFTAFLYTEITSKLGRKEIKVALSSECVNRVLPSP